MWAEGLVAVKLISSGKTGFMDIHGEMVIAPSYEEAGWFSEGLAPVKKGGKWGFINKTGKVVWDFRYDLLLPPKRSIVEAFLDGKRYWFNIRQEVLFTSDRSYRLNPLSDELVGLSLTGQPWIVLSSEKVIAGPERGYLLVRLFREGFAAVMRFSPQNVPWWGLIDIEGREVVSCSWEDITDASGNHVAVKSRGRWRFVDVLSGKVATGLEYKAVAYEGHEGYFLVEDVAGKKGTWSKDKGFSLWDSDSVGPWIWRDMFLVKKSGLKGVGNARTGQVIVPPLYEEIKWCEESSLLLVKQGGKTGYWGLHGEEIISPRYREGGCFVKNFAVVTEESGEKMIIDKMGNAKISLPQDTTKVFLPDGTMFSSD